jgi:hypothetical protein
MWKRPWGFKEGLCIGGGLFITGMLLQLSAGGIDWSILGFPINLILIAVLLLLIVSAHIFRDKVYLFRWLGSSKAAVSSIAWCVALTVVMGLTRQAAPTGSAGTAASFPGFHRMTSNWAFLFEYLWLTFSLGLSILRVCIPLRPARIPFLLNHLGLFIVLVCATASSADLQRLRLTARTSNPEWRAIDEGGNVHELPIAIELKQFTIDEYPPKLMLADNLTGQALPAGKPESFVLEPNAVSGKLGDWKISVRQLLLSAAPMVGTDSVNFVEFHSSGAGSAAYVTASKASETVSGWVSCGSYMFPYKSLPLDDKVSVIMPDREPRRFASAVKVYSKSGKTISDTISVNHPLTVDGWKIYQTGYDETMGKWSESSTFEIVRDPWLPYVYVGIYMLIAGAVCLFLSLSFKKMQPDRKEEVQ